MPPDNKSNLPATTHAQSLPVKYHALYGPELFLNSLAPGQSAEALDFEALESEVRAIVERIRAGDWSDLHRDLLLMRGGLLASAAHWQEQAVRATAPTTQRDLMRMTCELLRLTAKFVELQIALERPGGVGVAVQINNQAASTTTETVPRIVGGDDA